MSANKIRLRMKGGRVVDTTDQPQQNPAVAAPLQPIEIPISRKAIRQIIKARKKATSRVFTTVEDIHKELNLFFKDVPVTLPPKLQGQVFNPDGTFAASVSVKVERPKYSANENIGEFSWPTRAVITDSRGSFHVILTKLPIPENGLRLIVRGGNGRTELTLRRSDLLGMDGRVGELVLDRSLTPLRRSVIAELSEIVPTGPEDVEENPEDFADPPSAFALGEGDCAQSFRSNVGVIDRFRFSLLVRLIDPQMSVELPVLELPDDLDALKFNVMPITFSKSKKTSAVENAVLRLFLGQGRVRLFQRSPISRPIDVTDFLTDVAEDPGGVPLASSLGLGYIVEMQQVWIPSGLSLGDLLYSLPLAPGEEQRVAIFEQVESLSVTEREALSLDERQRFSESADTSTRATFESAFTETAEGRSDIDTQSGSFGVGLAGGIGGLFGSILAGVGLAGGYGSASSSGDTNTWQHVSRDFTSTATEEFHSRLSRNAAARRRSARTGVRLATAADREQVTTKVIANNNHCHALTIQYWEVLRHFAVSTNVDNVRLVCFVPFEVIQFRPDDEPDTLPTEGNTRASQLKRYSMLLQYHDVLARRFARRPEYRYGLSLLKDFAANPAMEMETSNVAQNVISCLLTGTFVPYEQLFASIVTRTGTHIGPITMVGVVAPIPKNEYSDEQQLLADLRSRRRLDAQVTFTLKADLVLPNFVARSDVAGFEFTRRVNPLTYTFKREETENVIVPGVGVQQVTREVEETKTFSADRLEREVGGPVITQASATMSEGGTEISYIEGFTNRSEPMGASLPIAASRIDPVLSFADLLRIEAVYQHVVRNTVAYSKAVWISLTPEERAILLERFTIGVPTGGIEDESQQIPLMSCVTNQVLGFFGNSMIMPFHIPPQLAAAMEINSGNIQDALLRFHRQAFAPSRTVLTLPTRGTLGEAVLGACNACEKVDLTRFWNWQDSPHPTAEKPPQFLGKDLVGKEGAEAPSSLVPTSPVNLLNIASGEKTPTSPSALSEILKQTKTLVETKDVTGLATLQKQLEQTLTAAKEARAEAVTTAKSLAEKAMDKLPEAIKAKAGIEEKNKEQDTKKKVEKQKKKTKKTSTGLSKLKENASAFISLVAKQKDELDARTMTQAIITDLFGDEEPPLSDLAALFTLFEIKEDDDEKTKLAKRLFQNLLGFNTTD